MSCENCGPSDGSPPDSTPRATSPPLGTGSSYGGATTIARGRCGPAKCPAPLTTQDESADPYKPGWIAKLLTNPVGKLIVAVGDYLYLLRSKCSGYIYFNAETEQVSVEDPPFVSAIPKETRFGFIAKAVPTVHQLCADGNDLCPTEVRQEMAAQLMEEASCGQLVIARAPDCGELAPADSTNFDKQVRLDYLTPKDLKSDECPGEVRFLLKRPGKRGKTDCDQWVFMRRLKMPKSQWGELPEDSVLADDAQVLVLVPTAGSDDDEDPCFEMRLSRQKLQPPILPGGRIYMLETEHPLAFGINSGLPRYAEMVALGTKVWAIVSQRIFVTGNTSAGGTFGLKANGTEIGWMYLVNGGGDVTSNSNAIVDLSSDSINMTIGFTGVGSPSYSSSRFRLRGYLVE